MLSICVSLLCNGALADHVRFDNENHLQGELKRLERGELYFKTAGTDTISIEWNHVDALSSTQQLEIELDDGTLYYGTLAATGHVGEVEVQQQAGAIALNMSSIVKMTQIEDEFRERFDGSISAGVNLTQANNYESYNLGIDLDYVTRKYVSSLDISSRINQSDQTNKAEQSDLSVRSSRRLRNRWYTGGLLTLDRNEELGIDLRSSIGITVGKSVVHNNSQNLHIDGGLLYTEEKISGYNQNNESEEAFIGLSWDVFRYDEPEFDLSTRLVAIPSISESGRTRARLDVTLRWEMIEDLYWRLSFQGSYDNQPPGEDASTTDYSVVSGLAYDF